MDWWCLTHANNSVHLTTAQNSAEETQILASEQINHSTKHAHPNHMYTPTWHWQHWSSSGKMSSPTQKNCSERALKKKKKSCPNFHFVKCHFPCSGRGKVRADLPLDAWMNFWRQILVPQLRLSHILNRVTSRLPDDSVTASWQGDKQGIWIDHHCCTNKEL